MLGTISLGDLREKQILKAFVPCSGRISGETCATPFAKQGEMQRFYKNFQIRRK